MFKFSRKAEEPAPRHNSPEPAPRHNDRRDLLRQISNFLLDNQLEVNPANLTLAQALFSGGNPGLSRQIFERQRANEPVSQEWLNEMTRDGAKDVRRRNAEAAGLPEIVQLARADTAIDDVSGLDSSRTFETVLEHELRAAREAVEPLSIAFCDIDRFQTISDTHGRDTGDRVIQAIARALQRVSAQNCHVARRGGEEFAVLFRGLTPDEACNELNYARENFAQRRLVDRKTHKAIGSVTFSGGVADVLAYSDPRAALKAADEALREARERGRNRIVIASKRG